MTAPALLVSLSTEPIFASPASRMSVSRTGPGTWSRVILTSLPSSSSSFSCLAILWSSSLWNIPQPHSPADNAAIRNHLVFIELLLKRCSWGRCKCEFVFFVVEKSHARFGGRDDLHVMLGQFIAQIVQFFAGDDGEGQLGDRGGCAAEGEAALVV